MKHKNVPAFSLKSIDSPNSLLNCIHSAESPKSLVFSGSAKQREKTTNLPAHVVPESGGMDAPDDASATGRTYLARGLP